MGRNGAASEHSVATPAVPKVSTERRKTPFQITPSFVVSAIMALVGLATFAATYVFATKNEVATKQTEMVREVGHLSGEIGVIKNDVRYIKKSQDNMADDIKKLVDNQSDRRK